LPHKPAVDFIVWVRVAPSNECIEGTYLIPVSDFPDHYYIWPSARSLAKYEQDAHPSIASIFGLRAAARIKSNSSSECAVTMP